MQLPFHSTKCLRVVDRNKSNNNNNNNNNDNNSNNKSFNWIENISRKYIPGDFCRTGHQLRHFQCSSCRFFITISCAFWLASNPFRQTRTVAASNGRDVALIDMNNEAFDTAPPLSRSCEFSYRQKKKRVGIEMEQTLLSLNFYAYMKCFLSTWCILIKSLFIYLIKSSAVLY